MKHLVLPWSHFSVARSGVPCGRRVSHSPRLMLMVNPVCVSRPAPGLCSVLARPATQRWGLCRCPRTGRAPGYPCGARWPVRTGGQALNRYRRASRAARSPTAKPCAAGLRIGGQMQEQEDSVRARGAVSQVGTAPAPPGRVTILRCARPLIGKRRSRRDVSRLVVESAAARS